MTHDTLGIIQVLDRKELSAVIAGVRKGLAGRLGSKLALQGWCKRKDPFICDEGKLPWNIQSLWGFGILLKTYSRLKMTHTPG